ncbi:hypothetical protein [Allorhizobium terrae]|uniref:Uncharacterized protein n=1 Tax=Allorhizobium terrae TaxID=1848972 RepID=A0A4S4A1T2_9HYPH|nr:hypothetical protein [Allorhizobium terrae]THF52180.1 hypothetical protein E6C51_05035 [Allorhizobium terrae]
MSNPISSFIKSLLGSIKGEMTDRRKYKEKRLQRASAVQTDKPAEIAKPVHRSKSARQARRRTRNNG